LKSSPWRAFYSTPTWFSREQSIGCVSVSTKALATSSNSIMFIFTMKGHKCVEAYSFTLEEHDWMGNEGSQRWSAILETSDYRKSTMFSKASYLLWWLCMILRWACYFFSSTDKYTSTSISYHSHTYASTKNLYAQSSIHLIQHLLELYKLHCPLEIWRLHPRIPLPTVKGHALHIFQT